MIRNVSDSVFSRQDCLNRFVRMLIFRELVFMKWTSFLTILVNPASGENWFDTTVVSGKPKNELYELIPLFEL